MAELKIYEVWDAPTRWFHWINVLCVIALAGIGTVILQAGALGIPNDGKILLKTVHVWAGYVFALNLTWRIVWAFIGNRHARWRQLLPGGRGYVGALREYVHAARAGEAPAYLGHNPVGRIAVGILLLLLATMAVTGLVLAGTDIFYPPLGQWIAESISAPGVDPASLQPYAKEMYDATAYDAMRAARKPFALTHVYAFYTLMVMVVVHIGAVVVTEIREGGSLISAMFSGRKVFSRKPRDLDY
ncbi:MAG: cytochrome b/b6 domain-containing protein [Nevskiales bacterium]|nr:cytochrome b/b6 domain-containing protein [Nevskiales bacterium]